jgi:hypothetical protein
MDDTQNDYNLLLEKYIPIINDIVVKIKELGLDIVVEMELVSKLYDLKNRKLYIDIVGSLPHSYNKQVSQFLKYLEQVKIPQVLLNTDVRVNEHITNKFIDFQQITNITTGELANFDIPTHKVTLICYYNVMKNIVDGNTFPYVSESMKYLSILNKLLDKNDELRKKVKVGAFTCNKEHADFIKKYIHKKKLKHMEHYFISEYKKLDPKDISLGSSPLVILLDKNKVIRYFGNPLYTDLEANINNLYGDVSVTYNYTDNPRKLLTTEEQNDTIDKLSKFYKDVLQNHMRCFSTFTLHFKKVIDNPIVKLSDMRCSIIAEVDNLTNQEKHYVDSLFSHMEDINPKVEIDLNNIYTESLDTDRGCCMCQ